MDNFYVQITDEDFTEMNNLEIHTRRHPNLLHDIIRQGFIEFISLFSRLCQSIVCRVGKSEDESVSIHKYFFDICELKYKSIV